MQQLILLAIDIPNWAIFGGAILVAAFFFIRIYNNSKKNSDNSNANNQNSVEGGVKHISQNNNKVGGDIVAGDKKG